MGFQRLQGRIHLSDAKDVERIDREQPVAFIAFDMLREGNDDLRGLPLVERRARLERLFGASKSGTSASASRPPATAVRCTRARKKEGWEGLIVKEARSPYQSGRRSPSWRKLKLHHEQEFVVGGWTEPRNTRQYFGALLLGVYQGIAGSRRQGSRATAEAQHWSTSGTRARVRSARARAGVEAAQGARDEAVAVRRPDQEQRNRALGAPELVAQVRFTEWTDDGKLRHPVYLGLRDDKSAESVVREVPAARAMREACRAEASSAAAPARHEVRRSATRSPPKSKRERHPRRGAIKDL